MKRLFLSLCLIISFGTLAAQNIQLHYDFGRSLYNELDGRPLMTSTIEHFHPDSWGNTFFFVDMNYTSNGVSSAYMEIFRQISFSSKCPINLHFEYNGGVIKNGSLNNAYLTGLTYNYNSKDFLKGISFSVLYKYLQKNSSPQSFQFTTSWYYNFSDGLFTCCGFADLWREKTNYGLMIFLTEPQFWVNLNKIKGINDRLNLSVGSEVKLSHNFEGRDGFYCIPTLAMKWTL
ncbi:DUF5020 family protein [Bacteroides sp.]|uniref:nucleoside-specific channel-forming Tsx family protein n=1 Tax=Bacteroides sp. TaxID=29523 RepID=UPI00258851C4|nr:DUF5020 family protein [Bacteroides sp.]